MSSKSRNISCFCRIARIPNFKNSQEPNLTVLIQGMRCQGWAVDSQAVEVQVSVAQHRRHRPGVLRLRKRRLVWPLVAALRAQDQGHGPRRRLRPRRSLQHVSRGHWWQDISGTEKTLRGLSCPKQSLKDFHSQSTIKTLVFWTIRKSGFAWFL